MVEKNIEKVIDNSYLPTRTRHDGTIETIPPVRKRVIDVWAEKKNWLGRTVYKRHQKSEILEYFWDGEWKAVPEHYDSIDLKD